MRKSTRILLTVAALGAAGLAYAAGKPALVINGETVSQERFDAIIKNVTGRSGQPDSPQLREQIKSNIISSTLLAQVARDKGLDKTEEYLTEIEIVKQQILAQALVRDFIKSNPVSDAELKAEYDKLKSQFGAGKEFKARHILVKTEAEANDALKQIQKGRNFEELAKRISLDGSKANGGDLGWSKSENYVKPFADAMVKLKKGQITAKPVKSEFGFHLIKLDDVREQQGPSFEDVRPQLAERKQKTSFDEYLKTLRAKAKIEE